MPGRQIYLPVAVLSDYTWADTLRLIEVCMALAMVEKAYVERLQGWIQSEVAKFADDGGKGINAYSGHTYQVLAQFGESGFPSAMISRWHDGKIKSELRSPTLARVGLLRGLSTDKVEAERRAFLWLSGALDPNDVPSPAPGPAPRAATLPPAIAALLSEASPEVIYDVAIAALDQLRSLATVPSTPVAKEETRVKPLALIVSGWLAEQGQTLTDLADALSCDEDRAAAIADGAVLTAVECVALASLLGLQVSTLIDWGACPELKAQQN